MGQTGTDYLQQQDKALGTLDIAGGDLREKPCWRRIPTMSKASPGRKFGVGEVGMGLVQRALHQRCKKLRRVPCLWSLKHVSMAGAQGKQC